MFTPSDKFATGCICLGWDCGGGEKQPPPDPPGTEDPCAVTGIRKVDLEVDKSQSVSSISDWLDLSSDGEIRSTFSDCCTDIKDYQTSTDTLAVDRPVHRQDCKTKAIASFDLSYDANLHLILAMRMADENDSDLLGYSWSGMAVFGGCSWVFTERIDEFLDDNNNGASPKALAINVATHELGHHRANLTEACTSEWNEEEGRYEVNSSFHYDEDLNEDGDCVMCTKYAPSGTATVYSWCGSDKSQLHDLYFCDNCKNTIMWVSW